MYYARSFAVELASYTVLTYIAMAIICVELLLVVLILLTYRAYTQGLWYFAYLKRILIVASVLTLLLRYYFVNMFDLVP